MCYMVHSEGKERKEKQIPFLLDLFGSVLLIDNYSFLKFIMIITISMKFKVRRQ